MKSYREKCIDLGKKNIRQMEREFNVILQSTILEHIISQRLKSLLGF